MFNTSQIPNFSGEHNDPTINETSGKGWIIKILTLTLIFNILTLKLLINFCISKETQPAIFFLT